MTTSVPRRRRAKESPVEITIADLGFQPEYTKSSERILQIVLAAAELFHQKGFGPTTTRDIGEACGMSQGHLYYYIKSKDHLPFIFRKIHDEDMATWERNVRREMARLPADKLLEKAVRDYALIVHLRRKIIAFWYHAQTQIREEDRAATHDVESRIDKVFVEIIERGNEEGIFHVKDPLLTAINIFMMAQNWALKRWLIRDDRTIDQYIDTIVELAIAMARGSPDEGPASRRRIRAATSRHRE